MKELLNKFLHTISQEFGFSGIKQYMIYIRILSILMEIPKISIQDLINAIEPEFRDVKLIMKILKELKKIGIIELKKDLVIFNYRKYEEIRQKFPNINIDSSNLMNMFKIIFEKLRKMNY